MIQNRERIIDEIVEERRTINKNKVIYSWFGAVITISVILLIVIFWLTVIFVGFHFLRKWW